MATKTYFGDWGSKDELLDAYSISARELEGATMLFAWYSYANYSGSSFVLFEKDGVPWIDTSGHCSCNGLEGSWSPQKLTWATLAKMIESDRWLLEDSGVTVRNRIYRLVKKHHPELGKPAWGSSPNPNDEDRDD